MTLAPQWSEGGRSFIGWVVPASIVLHVAAITLLPSARRFVASTPPLVVEVAEPPPVPERKEEPPPPPSPSRAALSPQLPAASPVRAAVHRRVVPETSASPPPTTAAPADFTSTVFSNEGPGVETAGGRQSAVAAASPGPVIAAGASKITPAEPRVVAPSSLARRPRAPGLDAELERQYPLEARRAGISGTASLRLRILADGRIGSVNVLSETWAGFGSACERTVRAARWEPPIDRDGSSVATEITYTCRFEVRN